MGNILRRVTAFLLGIVFTVTSLVGGVVGGAYYAYKNVSPLEGTLDSEMQESLGDLYNATIEEWLDLINNAQDPGKYGEYTFERLAEEYGLDLAKLLEQLGLDVGEIDQESEDWKALEQVSILSMLASDGGFDKVLESIKLKALYVLAPAVLGGPIDNYLSPEAQSALGDYSIAELLAADEATGELGIVQAIKGLKIGSFLPEIFEASFDVKTNEYVYTVKQDGSLKDFTFLNLIGSVPLQGIFNIVEGGDVMTELFEGEFKSITSLPVSEILGMFADVAGEETADVIKQYTQVFGDVSVRDLFELNEEGKYEFAYENLLSGLELGYLFGYTKTDGEWLDKDGNAPTGLLGFVAGISIGDVLNNEGDVIGMINAAAGDLTIKTIYETIVAPDENGDYPMIIERLGTVKVSDVLGGGAENIVSNLKISLRNAFDGATLYEIVALFGEDLQNKLADIPIVDALLKMEINSFIRDEYDLQSILYIISDALGDLTVGDIAKQEPTDDALGLLWKYELANIIEGVISLMNGAKPGEIAGDFLGDQYTVGEIFSAFTGYAYNETVDNWGKDGNYIAEGLVPLMKTSVAKFAYLFEENPSFDMFEVIGDIQIADVAYTALQVAGINDILEKHVEDGDTTYLLAGDLQDFAQLSKVVLTITVDDLVNNATKVDFWLDRARQITLGDLTAYVINNLLPVEMELIYNKGQWVVTTDYLAGLMSNVFNTSVGGVIDAVATGDAEVVKQKIFAKLGETNVGDVAYAALGLAGVKDVVVSATSASGYALANGYSDFNNIAEALFGLSINNIIDNATDVDWWFEKLGNVKVGDAVAYFINKFAPDMNATLENGDWKVTGNLGAVLTGLFNVKVSDLRDPDAVQIIKDAFGTLSIGDVCGSFVPENIAEKDLIQKVFEITVNNIIDMVNSENMATLVLQLQDAFEGMKLRNVVELFDIQGYDYGLFERILNTEFEFLLGLIVNPDIVGELMYEFGDISLGEVAYTVLKVAGIENVLTEGNGAYYAYGDYEDFESLSRKLLSVTVEEVMNNLNADYWIDRLGQINVGDLTAYVVNKLLPVEVELIYNKGQWLATTDYLADLIANVANTTIGGMIDTFTSGDAELIKEKAFAVLGDTNVGDVAYAVCGLAKLPAFVQTSDSACGYELSTEYADFNNLAQAVMGLKLTDIVNNATSGEFWLNSFNAITVGDLADFFIPDELETNKFMAAVRDLSVEEINAIVKAETSGQRVALIQDVFNTVLVSDILSLANINEINNEALKKLADTELVFLIGLAINPDIIGEIAYEFGDITLGDAIATFVKDVIDLTNPFIDATLGISVEDVIDMATAANVSAILDTIYNIYVGVMIGDVVNAFPVGKVNVAAIDKVYALLINDVIKAIDENNIVNFLYEKFGDVALADLALNKATVIKLGGYSIGYVEGAWMATSANTNLDELLTNVLNTKLGTIYNNVTSQENLKNDLVTLLGNTTIGEAGELAYNNALGIGLLDKVYDVKLADIVSNAFDGTIAQFLADFIYGISINDLVGFVLSESLRSNNFINKTLAVDGETIYNVAAAGGLAQILLAVSDIYEGVTLGDIAAIANVNKAPLSILEPVFAAGLDDLIESIARGETVQYAIDTLGNISVNNIVTDIETIVGADIIPASIEENNNLVKAILGVTVYDVYAIAASGKVLNDIGIILDGATLGDVVSLFMSTDTTFAPLATLYTLDIGKTLVGLANNDVSVPVNVLTKAFNELPDVIKYSVYAAVGVTAGVLYFVNNPLLCQLSDQFLGEGTTWGSLLSSTLGYQKNSEGKYINNIGYNGLMDTLLSETVTETLTTGYPLFKNVKDELTLGNLLTLIGAESEAIELSTGMRFVQTDKGFALDNELYAFADALFNIALGDFFTEDGSAVLTSAERGTVLYYAFEKVNVGDLTAYFFNLIAQEGAKAEKVDGKWTVNTQAFAKVITKLMNVTVDDILRLSMTGDAAYCVEKIKGLFGDITLGDFITPFIEGVIDITNPFIDSTLKISVNDVIDILTATSVNAILDTVYNRYTGVMIGGVLGAFYKVTANVSALDKVYSLLINDVIKAISENNIIKFLYDKFGDVALADLVFVQAKAYALGGYSIGYVDGAWMAVSANTNLDELLTNVLNIKLGTIYNDVASQENLKNDIVTLLGNTTIGEAGELAYNNAYGIGLIDKVYGIKLADIVSCAFDGNVAQFIADFIYDLSINDLVGFMLSETLRNNAFLKATLAVDGTTIYNVLAAGGLAQILLAVSDIYEGVTLGDIAAIANVNKAPLSILEPVFAAGLDDLIESIARGETVQYAIDTLGNISVNNIVTDIETIAGADIIPASIEGNALIKAVLAIDVNDVIALLGNGTILKDVGTILDDVTLGDVVSLFMTTDTTFESLATLYTIDIGKALVGFATGDSSALLNTLTTAFNQLPDAVKYSVFAAAGITIGVLYFVDNPLLCKLSNQILGEGTTWGDLVAGSIGYAKNDDGKYVNYIGYNGLMNTLLSATVTETITTGYPLFNNIKGEVTLGNLLTAYAAIPYVIENSIGMNFVETADGGLALDNEFYSLADALFNIALGDFLTEENKFLTKTECNTLLYNTFGTVNLGDLGAYFFNLYAKEGTKAEKVDSTWTVNGEVLTEVLSNAMNISLGGIYRAIKANDKAYYIEKAKELFGDTNLGDVTYAILSSTGVDYIVDKSVTYESGYTLTSQYYEFDKAAQCFFGIKIADIVENTTNRTYWRGVFGELTIGDFANYFIPDELEANNFIKTTTAITANVAYDLIKSASAVEFVNEVCEIYDGVTVYDLVSVFVKLNAPSETVKTIFNVELSDLALAIMDNRVVDFLYNTFGDEKIGNVVFDTNKSYLILGYTVLYTNDAWKATSADGNLNELFTNLLNVTLGTIYDDATAAGDLEKDIATVLGNTTVGEIGSLLYKNEQNIGAVTRIYNVKLANIANSLFRGTTLTLCKDLLFDITLHDLLGFLLNETVRENAFVKATLSVNTNKVIDIVNAGSTEAVINRIADLYTAVTFNDVTKLFNVNEAPVAVLKPVFAASVEYFIRAIADNTVSTYVLNTVGEINVGDVVYSVLQLIGDTSIMTETKLSASGYVLVEKYDEFNRLAQKAFAISVRNVVDNIQNGEYWIELVKDITLGDVVNYFIPEEVEKNVFIKATTSVSVEKIMNIANAVDAKALIAELQSIYTKEIEIHDVFGYEAADALGYDLVTKLFDTDLYFLLGLAVSEDPLSEIRAEFGDITLGDAMTKFYASENVFVKATYSFSVDQLFEVLATATTKDALTVIAGVYKNVTIGDIIKLANVNEAPVAVLEPIFAASIEGLIKAIADNAIRTYVLDTVGVISVGDVVYSVLQIIGDTTLLTETKLASSGYALAEQYQEFNNFAQKVLGITVRDLVDNVTSRSYWYELFKDVKIGDLVNYFIPDDIQSKKFIKTIVSITAEDVYGIIKAADNNERVAKLQAIFKNVELHDVFGYDEADALGYDVATKVMDTELSFFLGLITSNDRLTEIRTEFGDITLGDAMTKFYASENAFVKATYTFSVDDVFKILDAAGTRAKLNVIAKLYEGVTAQDALQLVTDYTTTRASINEALTLDLGVAAQAVLNQQYSYFRTYAKSVYNVTTRNEKLLIAGVAGVGATALYFINNELLCKAIDKVLGPDVTWGDLLADNFGYALTSDGYMIDGLHNELMNTLFSQKITTVLQDGYPFGSTFRPLMTIGNLITVHPAMIEAINKLGLTLVEDVDQDLMVAGNLANITKSIFALGLNDFMPTGTNLASAAELKNVLYNAFSKNVFGDVLAVVINRQNFVSLEAVYDGTQWVVLGTMGDFIGRCLNVSFAEAWDLLKNRNYSIITDIIGDMTLLDFVSVVKKDIGSNPTVALVLSLKVKDLLQVVRGKESITSLVGGWTLEELAGNYLPARIDKDSEFAETLLNMTLSELNAMRKGNMKAQIMDKFGEFTFAEALAAIKYDASTADALIVDILQLKLNIFDGGMNAGIDAIMDTVKAKKIGVFLEYEYDEVNGVWLNGGTKVTGIMATLADMSIKQITDDPNFFNNMTLGEALGYEFDGVDWIDGEGNTVTGIMAAFADVTIGGLDEATLKSKVNNITLGEVMTIDATSHKVLVALQDTKIGELSNAMNDLELGEVIEIDASSPQVLQTLKTEKLSDLTTAFNDLTLGEVIVIDASSAKALQSLQDKKINELSTAFNDLTLGEVLDIDGSNTILKALEDSKITDMSNDINDMYLGTIMGYVKSGTVWIKYVTTGTTTTVEEASGIARVLVDKQVKDLTNANFATDLVDELTVGDVFPEAGTATATDPLIKFIEADWKINELGTKLSAKFNSDAFTVQTAIDLGIFGTLLNDGVPEDGCYGTLITTVYGSNAWKNMAVSKFIEYILVRAFIS